MPPTEPLDARASALMQEGIRRMADLDAAAPGDALACFDEALALRRQLPLESDPRHAYGLAACWLNRAEALLRPGPHASARDAVAACDEALALMARLPLEGDPKYRRRAAIAHQHRGLALLAAAGPDADAIAAFRAAAALLDASQADAIEDRPLLLAAVLATLAACLVASTTEGDPARARTAAERALSLSAVMEDRDPVAAEVSLKARHTLCRLLARRLGASVPGHVAAEDVHDATDHVDAGLALARAWERRGQSHLRELAGELFRFGTGVYGRFQPHFVKEFVLENTDAGSSSSGYVASEAIRVTSERALRLASLSLAFTRPPGR